MNFIQQNGKKSSALSQTGNVLRRFLLRFQVAQCFVMLWFPFNLRVNLSPFTKDYRGGEQMNEPQSNFCTPAERWGILPIVEN